MSDRRISVKKVKWLIPDALAAIFFFGRRSSPAIRGDAPGEFVAHADVLHGGGGVDRQGHPAEGVGEVDQEGVGAVPGDVVADAEDGLDRAQGVEDRAGPPVLAGDLGRAVAAGDLVVLHPTRPAVDLCAGQAEVGAGECLGGVEGALDPDRAPVSLVHPVREAPRGGETTGVHVVEHHRRTAHPAGVDGVEDHYRPERHAARPDEADLRSRCVGHALPFDDWANPERSYRHWCPRRRPEVAGPYPDCRPGTWPGR